MTPKEPPAGLPPVPGMAELPYLRAWRIYRKMGLLELARKSGASRTLINDAEQGRRKVTAAKIGALAQALKIKPTMLVYVNPEDLPENRTGAA